MNMKDMDIEENDSSRYEIWYNHIYDYISSHNALKNVILFTYKVLPYFVAVSYIVLIVMCLRTKGAIVTPTLSFSVDATGYVETSNLFVTSKLILTPLTSFIVVSFFRKCIDAQRPYVKYNITPLVKKDKEGESMPSRHVFSITIIAMCWFYIYQPYCSVCAYSSAGCIKGYNRCTLYKRCSGRNSSRSAVWVCWVMDIIIKISYFLEI